MPKECEDCAFMVLTREQSFVAVASDPIEKAEWVAVLRGVVSLLASPKLPTTMRSRHGRAKVCAVRTLS